MTFLWSLLSCEVDHECERLNLETFHPKQMVCLINIIKWFFSFSNEKAMKLALNFIWFYVILRI